MKRDINIRITLTDEPANGITRKTGPNSFHITVSSKDMAIPEQFKGKGIEMPILFHELGHAIGEAVLGDLQEPSDYFAKGFLGITTPNIVAEETRAWDIGQRVFNQVREYALDTYKSKMG